MQIITQNSENKILQNLVLSRHSEDAKLINALHHSFCTHHPLLHAELPPHFPHLSCAARSVICDSFVVPIL
jgi:hypothetical protein